MSYTTIIYKVLKTALDKEEIDCHLVLEYVRQNMSQLTS